MVKHTNYDYTTKTNPHEEPPSNCRDTTIKGRYKSGEPSSPSNYRPICSITILYELFSELFSRSVDQANSRLGHVTTDHLTHQTLWVAAFDSKKKAFDTVEHSSVWKAVREQGIGEPYIQLLTKLYDQQRATAHTDVKCKTIPPRAGKHAQPSLVQLTPTVHNETTVREPWNGDNKGVGLAELDHDAILPSLGFADDILLISGSLKQTTTKLDDFIITTMACSLQRHHTKKHLQHHSKTTSKQHGSSSTDEHRDLVSRRSVQVEVDHRIKCA